MDGSNVVITGAHRKRAAKNKKHQKKKPVKIVYISNPMMVHTSASEFRTLVQELTGRDAEFPDPSKFSPTGDGGSRHRTAASPESHVEVPAQESGEHVALVDAEDVLFDGFEDLFPPVIGNFSGLLQSAVMYQSYAA